MKSDNINVELTFWYKIFFFLSVLSLVLAFFDASPYLNYVVNKKKPIIEEIVLENVWIIVTAPPKFGLRQISFLSSDNKEYTTQPWAGNKQINYLDFSNEAYYGLCYGLEGLICNHINLAQPIFVKKIIMEKSVSNTHLLIKNYQIGNDFYQNPKYHEIINNPIQIYLRRTIFSLKLSIAFMFLYLMTYFVSRLSCFK